MADLVSGIKGVPPSYPIKPVQPGPQDRKSGQRKKDQPRKDPTSDHPQDDQNNRPGKDDNRQGNDDGQPPSIDEYV